jgi:methyl-accepting chemotaxis protein
VADLTYKQLQQHVAALHRDVTRAAEAIRARAKEIDEEAQDTARVADSIGALKVDKDTVSETREVSKIMAGLSEAVIAYATAGDNTAKAAQAAHEQNHASHDGIHEAVGRSPVGPDIYSVERDWFRQE